MLANNLSATLNIILVYICALPLQGDDIFLPDAMLHIQRDPVCVGKPIFMTMATVGDDLYWQLIENFVYTLVKFNVSDCSLVICVSDPHCMELCAGKGVKFYCLAHSDRGSNVLTALFIG
jgi:hypothetical protein